MQRFDPRLLTALDALLTERSVTRAAVRLNVSQPTMSGILQRLREQLDDPLLLRSGSELVLTPRAIGIAPMVREALLAIDQVFQPREIFDPATARCHFTIMASDYGLQLVLPGLFREAERTAPGIGFSILPVADPVGAVSEGGIDLCLVGDPSIRRERKRAALIRTRVILREHYVCVVAADHALAGPIDAARYRACRRATVRFGLGTPTLEQMILADPPAEPAHIAVPGFYSLGAIIAGGETVALLPYRVAMDLARMYPVRAVPIDFPCERPQLRALWNAGRDRDAGHRWLRDTIAAATAMPA